MICYERFITLAWSSFASMAWQQQDDETQRTENIEKVEANQWEAADNLDANTKLSSSEHCMPVLGIIFLCHAANRFDAATREIEADQAVEKMPPRPVVKAGYVHRRALFLPENARYHRIMEQVLTTSDLGKLLTQTMTDIEAAPLSLANLLLNDYDIFEQNVLESHLQHRDAEAGVRRSVRAHLRVFFDEVRDGGCAGQGFTCRICRICCIHRV